MKRKIYFALMVTISALSLGGCSAEEDEVKDNGYAYSEQGTTVGSEAGQDTQVSYNTEIMEETENDGKEYPQETIEGYVYVDGSAMSVNVTFSVESIQRGEEAFHVLQTENAEIPQPNEGEEYIIVTFEVTYNEGEAEELYMLENRASQGSYALGFYLSNSESNAQDMTSYLSNSIYNISLSKGESSQGAVAFLQEKGNIESLNFVGFDESVGFNVNGN